MTQPNCFRLIIVTKLVKLELNDLLLCFEHVRL